MCKVTVFIADGTEETECLTIVDLLRRAGVDVRLVSIMETEKIVSSHKVTIIADGQFDTEDYSDSDMLFPFRQGAIPGTALSASD